MHNDMTADKLMEALEERVSWLRDNQGPCYKSVMEGYGNLVSIMNQVEEFYKDCRKSVKTFAPTDAPLMLEEKRDELNGMEREAVLLANAALAMAARMRLFRDTVVRMAGGDLLDMLDDAAEVG